MRKIYRFLNARCKFISDLLSARIKWWTALSGLVFSPTLFFVGLLLENEEHLKGYAFVLYVCAVLLYIPLIAEFSITNKD